MVEDSHEYDSEVADAFGQIEEHPGIHVEHSVTEIVEEEGDSFVHGYDIKGTGGQLYFETGPAVRNNGQIMDGGLLLVGDFKGAPLTNLRGQLTEKNGSGNEYISPVFEYVGPADAGSIEVPLDYDPEVLEETVEAAVQTAKQYQDVQDALRDTFDEETEELLTP